MPRTRFYLQIVVLTFGFCSSSLSSCAFAQENTNTKANEKVSDENVIQENQFKEILAKANEKLEGKIYRMTKTEESFSDRDASSESVATDVLEIIPPNKRREFNEFKSATKNTKTERIWDGKNLYEKENDGDWKQYSGGGGGSGDFTSGRTTTTYKFIRKELLNNKTANVYETESHRIASKATRTSQYRVEYVTKTKYWISEDGLFLKIIKESEIVGSKSLLRELSVYEYDSNIKIESPIK